MPTSTRVALMDQLVNDPNPTNAAALVEACLHSGNRLVRTSAAVAALDTTGAARRRGGPARRRRHPGPRDGEDIGRLGLSRGRPRPSGVAPGRRPPDTARRPRPALPHRLPHPRHVRGADDVVAARWRLLHLPRRARPAPARAQPELQVERPVLRRCAQARRAADARLGDQRGTAATGPLRPQPRRHGGEPGHRARSGARPARPARAGRSTRSGSRLRPRTTDHRHPGPAGPGDPRRPRRADVHAASVCGGQGDLARQRLVRARDTHDPDYWNRHGLAAAL